MNYATIDPDDLKSRSDDAHTLVFIDGKIYWDSRTGTSHAGYFLKGQSKSAERLRQRLGPEVYGAGYSPAASPDLSTEVWFSTYAKYLYGRVGHIADQETGQTLHVASFWGRGYDYKNPEARGPAAQIPACIQKLYYNELVDDDTIVVWGDGRVCTAGEILGGQTPPEVQIDPEVIRKNEMAKRMHLARGQEKQDIMKQLGVGGGGRQSPWSQALIRQGELAPGQDYWRMHSETQERRLGVALQVLQETPYTRTTATTTLPPTLAMLQDVTIDMGFDDWPDKKLQPVAEWEFTKGAGVQIPGTGQKLRCPIRDLLIEPAQGTEPELPEGWLRYVVVYPNAGGPRLNWVGKNVRSVRRPPDLDRYRDVGDGWIP